MATAVILGAFGAHAWKPILGSHIETYKTASLYHFIHALGILMLCVLDVQTKRSLRLACLLLTIGTVLFSGSLYILAFPDLFTGMIRSILGPITPIGGLFLIAGWLAAALEFYRKN
jgi:uncharacterized membrane protein YgdD (TMEM256/DUF423 family)